MEKLTGFSASQEIPRNLLKPKVHYRIHKSPPHLLMLSLLIRFDSLLEYIMEENITR
jgi:hypothetical protein